MTPDFADAGNPFGQCSICGHENNLHINGKCNKIIESELNDKGTDAKVKYCDCIGH